MNILIVGYMGVGKTTIAKHLAKKLNYTFVEMDQIVLRRTGFESVSEVYSYSPTLWKETELETSKDLSTNNHQVIALSSSAIENQLNFDYFAESEIDCKVIFLKATSQKLAQNIIDKESNDFTENDKDSLLTKLGTIILEQEPIFQHLADFVVDTTTVSIEENISKILTWLES